MEDILIMIEGNLVFRDAKSNPPDNRFINWDLPQGPDSGPEIPKKKRPKFI
jgi:hypothetical protein